MPEISRFYGIVVKMYYNAHAPPHFHAEHGGGQIVVAIDSLAVISGKLSPRATGLVVEWASQRHSDLLRVWDQARAQQPLDKVDPLD